MPIESSQIDSALAILAGMIAGLYREKIATGQMEAQEYRDLLRSALGDHEVNGALFAGPLAELFRLAPLR